MPAFFRRQTPSRAGKPVLAVLVLLVSLTLGACGGGGDDEPVIGGDPTPAPMPTPGPRTGDCTYVLTSDITVPSRLINTPSMCDYRLEGLVDLRSCLVIDPMSVC